MGNGAEPQISIEEKIESIRLLHDQALYLLDDEIHYASSLRDNRRTLATLLALLVGVGIFKIDFYRPASHVLVVPNWAFLAIRVDFVVCIALFLAAAYKIYTERPITKEFVSNGRGGALSILYIKDELVQDFAKKTPVEVWTMKTEGLRVAYYRLKESNRRVRRRLAEGTIIGFIGLVLVLAGIALYTVTVRVEEADNGTSNPAKSEASPPKSESGRG